MTRALAAVVGAAALAQWGPAVTSYPALRQRAWPTLSGPGSTRSIALTYDDGPDPATTPLFLDLLASHGVTATFFLLGAHVESNRSLVGEMAAAGHELAVHGWDHTCLAWKRPGRVVDELRRARAVVEDAGGREVRWHRPPYGVLTGEAALAARRHGLQTVLWSSWGRDWTRDATAERVAHTVGRTARPGGTVLLHDTDRTSAPGSWRHTLAASELLVADWHDRGLVVCSLSEHVAGQPPLRTIGTCGIPSSRNSGPSTT